MGKFLLVVLACVLSVGCSSGGGDSYVAPPTCEELACPETSSCVVKEGTRVCECIQGYTGDGCDECAEGYGEKDGVCLDRGSCAYDDFCGYGGHECLDLSNGIRDCQCPRGFFDVGDACDCYGSIEDGKCIVGRPCLEVNPCGRGVCIDDGEMTSCECKEGYAGARCDECPGDRVLRYGHCYLIEHDGEALCGDGRFEPSIEACDDGNNNPADGLSDFCSADCTEHVWPGGGWPGKAPGITETQDTRVLVELNESTAPYLVVDSGTELRVKVVGEHDFDYLQNDHDLNIGVFDSLGRDIGQSLCLHMPSRDDFGYSHTESVRGELVFTAPAESGTYYVRWSHGLAIRPCQLQMSNWGPEFNLFIIYVR